MTEEEIEVVARTIKAVLWENAEVIYDQTGFSEPDNSVGLDGGNDARVSDLIARAAITALDQHREGEESECSKAFAEVSELLLKRTRQLDDAEARIRELEARRPSY